jgi:hypothetical protein
MCSLTFIRSPNFIHASILLNFITHHVPGAIKYAKYTLCIRVLSLSVQLHVHERRNHICLSSHICISQNTLQLQRQMSFSCLWQLGVQGEILDLNYGCYFMFQGLAVFCTESVLTFRGTLQPLSSCCKCTLLVHFQNKILLNLISRTYSKMMETV